MYRMIHRVILLLANVYYDLDSSFLCLPLWHGDIDSCFGCPLLRPPLSRVKILVNLIILLKVKLFFSTIFCINYLSRKTTLPPFQRGMGIINKQSLRVNQVNVTWWNVKTLQHCIFLGCARGNNQPSQLYNFLLVQNLARWLW